MSAPQFFESRHEILREASAALGGRAVALWEVSARAGLVLAASSDPDPAVQPAGPEFDAALRRWSIPILSGSRWVGCRLAPDGPWVIAPVRSRPPAPPPGGWERRSRERLTLELAGLCLGLVDPREAASSVGALPADPLRDPASLPAVVAHEASNPLTSARASLQVTMESIGRWTDIGAGRRLEALDELGQVVAEIDRAVSFLRAVQDRARGAVARLERFDAVRVVRSCCTLESRVLKARSIPLVLETALESVYLVGDPNAFYDLLVNLLRNAADATAGRPRPIKVGLEQVGQSLRLTVRDEGIGIPPEDLGRIFEPGYTTKEFGKGSGMGLVLVQNVAQKTFRGSVSVESSLGGGATFTVAVPIPAQRLPDAAGALPGSR